MPYANGSKPSRPVDPSVLGRVLTRAAELGPKGLVIFDLDSTLLDNRPRQALILREYGTASGIKELTACQPEHFTGWSLRPPMLACGLPEPRVLVLEQEARRFWKERFFTSEYCTHDIALPGAVEYVHKVLGTGAQVVYCTGRHLPMRDGTLACFRREGFPLPAELGGDGPKNVHLLMKPTFDQHDDAWKVLARAQIQALGEPIAAFDNEPTHINTHQESFPEALCVHLATDDSARGIEVLQRIPSIVDFRMG